MIALVDFILFLAAAGLLALSAFFALEIVGAILGRRATPAGATPAKIALVVPAHDEEAAIAATVTGLKSQLRAGDRLIVVADNCADATASRALAAGAEVLSRDEPTRRGKGYALQCALDHLRAAPPDIVVFIDADCRAEPDAVLKIAETAHGSGRPVQGLYLMAAGADAPASRKASAFAWLLMNRVRMSGLYALFDVTRLTGAGMALPWALAAPLNLASGELVEDLALGLELAQKGHAPILRDDAVIWSELAVSPDGALAQRARWEHGSLRLAFRRAPGLIAAAVARRDLRLGAAAMDLAVPPLTLFGALLVGAVILGFVLKLLGSGAAVAAASFALAIFVVAVTAAWLAFGREVLPPDALAAGAGYLADKAKIYGAKARATTERWTRAERGPGGENGQGKGS